MLKSMTGYGKATEMFGEKKISCEIKSLNSKQIDMSVKLPSNYREYELEYRSLVTKHLLRGKVELIISIEEENAKNKTQISGDIAQNYYRQIKDISSSTGIPEPDSDSWFRILLSLPEVFQSDNTETAIEDSAHIVNVIGKALSNFDNFRQQEGNILEVFIKERINNISLLLAEVDKYEKERVQRIKERMDEDLKQIKSKIEIDQNRFEQEMIFYIEKLDISEEKSRLKCHLEYFLQTIDNEEHQGKKLGFIAQEIGREINTLGSKANHSEMQKIVVMMKDELEQIKEQILNVL